MVGFEASELGFDGTEQKPPVFSPRTIRPWCLLGVDSAVGIASSAE